MLNQSNARCGFIILPSGSTVGLLAESLTTQPITRQSTCSMRARTQEPFHILPVGPGFHHQSKHYWSLPGTSHPRVQELQLRRPRPTNRPDERGCDEPGCRLRRHKDLVKDASPYHENMSSVNPANVWDPCHFDTLVRPQVGSGDYDGNCDQD